MRKHTAAAFKPVFELLQQQQLTDLTLDQLYPWIAARGQGRPTAATASDPSTSTSTSSTPEASTRHSDAKQQSQSKVGSGQIVAKTVNHIKVVVTADGPLLAKIYLALVRIG
jgi:hypothetical protein